MTTHTPSLRTTSFEAAGQASPTFSLSGFLIAAPRIWDDVGDNEAVQLFKDRDADGRHRITWQEIVHALHEMGHKVMRKRDAPDGFTSSARCRVYL